jgi:predicted acyltransferase
VSQILAYSLLLAILIGLWLFQRWARVVFAILLLIGLVVLAFRGQPVFVPGVLRAIQASVYGITGALVTMMFLSPVRELFATGLTKR